MLRDDHYLEIASAVNGIQSSQFHDGDVGGDAFASASSAASFGGAGITQATGVFDSSASSLSLSDLHGNSMEWTSDEQAILDDGMIKYASETNIARYAKIAVKLNNKSVRDVALRCKWIAKSDISKRRKEDPNFTKKGKDRKEKVSDRLAMPSHVLMESGIIHSELTAIDGIYGQLIKQNVEAFDRIVVNLQANQQIEGNIALLCQARQNILQILNRLSNPPPNIVKLQMPPLKVEMDRVLANWILPPPPHLMSPNAFPWLQ